jgi:hypothetical protein
MTGPRDSLPILVKPHRLRGTGFVQLVGSGRIVLALCGEGHVVVSRRRRVRMVFEGSGRRRDPGPDCVVLVEPRGTLALDGPDLEVEFRGGFVSIEVEGAFDVTLDGSGEIEAPGGERTGWGLHPRLLRFDGARTAPRAA